MSDLVKRLRKQAHDARWSTMPAECVPGIDIDDAEEAAARIEALEAENARLREALKPFAIAAANFDRMPVKDAEGWFAYSGQSDHAGRTGAISVGDLRRARAALKGTAND